MSFPKKTLRPSKVWTISTSVMIALFLLLSNQYPLVSSKTINLGTFETQQAPQNRTLDFYWHSFFNVSMIRDVWEARENNYATHVLSWTFPVVYEETIFQGSKLPDKRPNPHPEGSLWYYTSARLRVTGRNLPEINITHPEFVPYNLLEGLSPTVLGGHANISYHMQYITEARAKQLQIYSPGWFDGYMSELNGTLTMDRNATQRILGLTSEEYELFKTDPTGWWDVNEETVEAIWEDFLNYEANTRLNILPMFLDPYVVFSSHVFPGVDLSLEYNALTDQAVLMLDVVAWGNEALLARWFHETFMKGYEAWYSDLYLDVAVSPSSSDVDLNTNVDWALYQWSADSKKYAPGVWAFEPYLGDEAGRIKYRGKIYPSSELAPYMFPNGTFKSYYNVAPGNAWYDEYQPYDYAPSAWNLLEGETLRINYTLPGPVWVLQQKPDGTLKNETGILDVSLIKPYPESFQGQITLNTTNQIVTFTGPMNVEEWSKINCSDQWMRLADNNYTEGALPLGLPYIEFCTYAIKIMEAEFNLTNLYTVHLYVNTRTFLNGTSLKVNFYSYSGIYQGEITVWNGTTPDHVLLSVNVSHPLYWPIENATLILTDNPGTINQKITNFVVCRSHLMERLAVLNENWLHALPVERSAIFSEAVNIDAQFPYAPPP